MATFTNICFVNCIENCRPHFQCLMYHCDVMSSPQHVGARTVWSFHSFFQTIPFVWAPPPFCWHRILVHASIIQFLAEYGWSLAMDKLWGFYKHWVMGCPSSIPWVGHTLGQTPYMGCSESSAFVHLSPVNYCDAHCSSCHSPPQLFSACSLL